MNSLVAVWGYRPDASALLPAADPLLSWHDGTVSLAGIGPLVSLAVADDLVVLVEGRVDDTGLAALETDSAADRVLAAARRWGAHFLDHVVGDVSGVVLDRPAGELRAFRDLVGIRPLHLAVVEGRHVVCSRLDALAGPGRPAGGRLCQDWLAHFLEAAHPPARLTPFAGVTAVVPGHVATPFHQSWSQRREAEWRLRPERRSDAEHAQAFLAVMDEAVSCRLRGVQRAGVELSGGLDSTTVLACARAVRPDLQLVALCFPFHDGAGDERALQQLAADRCGVRIRWVPLERRGPFGSSPAAVVRNLGAVPLVPNWFFHEAACEAAIEERLDLVMTGEDGDGVVGGGPAQLADLLTTGHVVRWTREAAALRRTTGVSWRRLLRRSLAAAGRPLPGGASGAAPFQLVPDPVRAAAGLVRASSPRPRRGGAHEAGVVDYLEGRYLPWLATAAGQAWTDLPRGTAHPFLDRRVVELCLSLPPEQRLLRGSNKAVLRRALVDRLPRQILERRGKARLSAPFVEAVRAPEGAAVITAAFAEAGQRSLPWLSPVGRERVLSAAPSTERDFAAYRIVYALALSRWLESGSAGEVSAAVHAPPLRDGEGVMT